MNPTINLPVDGSHDGDVATFTRMVPNGESLKFDAVTDYHDSIEVEVTGDTDAVDAFMAYWEAMNGR